MKHGKQSCDTNKYDLGNAPLDLIVEGALQVYFYLRAS